MSLPRALPSLIVGAAVLLFGVVAFAYEYATPRRHRTPTRVWNVMDRVGVGLPAPSPRLVAPTRTLLNLPLFPVLAAQGLLVVAPRWLPHDDFEADFDDA